MIRAVDVPALTKQIIGAVPIREYIANAAGVKFRRVGQNYMAQCPWHDDRKPSLSVKENSYLFYCHECKRGGNVVNFYMEFHQVSRHAALEHLNREIGGTAILAKNEIDPSIFTDVIDFCGDESKNQNNRTRLYQYLTDRGFSADECNMIYDDGVRFCPSSSDLIKYLSSKGRSAADIKAAGVATEDGTGLPALDEGVLYPVRRMSGDISHFIVRPLKTSEAKYINAGSDDNADSFYGLAKLKTGNVVLVEGVNDYYSLLDAKINVLAMNGLKFTEEQLRFLKSVDIEKVTIWVDGDTAGISFIENAVKLQQIADKLGVVLCFYYVAGLDPDEVIGTDRAEDYLTADLLSVAYLKYKFANLQAGDHTSVYSALYKASQVFAGCSRVTVMVVAEWFASRSGYDKELLFDELLSSADDKSSYTAERRVISAMLADPSDLRLSGVTVDWFSFLTHRRIGAAVLADGVSIANYRSVLPQYAQYIDDLLQERGVDLEHSLELLAVGTVKRAINKYNKSSYESAESLVSDITTVLYKTTAESAAHKKTDLYDITKSMIDDLVTSEKKVGLSYGKNWPMLNSTTLGLYEGKLSLLGGLTGDGKTTMALNWVRHISIELGVPGVFFSGEMDEEEVGSRLMTMDTGVDNTALITHAVNDQDLKKCFTFMGDLKPNNLFVETNMDFSRILYTINHHYFKHHIRYAIIDYAELIEPSPAMKDMARYLQLREITRRLKMEVCQKLKIPVVLLAQLNDEANNDKLPSNRHLSGAKGMAMDADVTMFLRRKTEKELALENNLGNILLHVDKVRYRPSRVLININMNHYTLQMKEVIKDG